MTWAGMDRAAALRAPCDLGSWYNRAATPKRDYCGIKEAFVDEQACPKCKHAMEEGRLSATGGEMFVFVPGKQPGMLKQTTRISRGLACPNCGYVELYLDQEQLRKPGA